MTLSYFKKMPDTMKKKQEKIRACERIIGVLVDAGFDLYEVDEVLEMASDEITSQARHLTINEYMPDNAPESPED